MTEHIAQCKRCKYVMAWSPNSILTYQEWVDKIVVEHIFKCTDEANLTWRQVEKEFYERG